MSNKALCRSSCFPCRSILTKYCPILLQYWLASFQVNGSVYNVVEAKNKDIMLCMNKKM